MLTCFYCKNYVFVKWDDDADNDKMETFMTITIRPTETSSMWAVRQVRPFVQRIVRRRPGVTSQIITPAGLYPGLKRPRLDYTRVYYGLSQFIPRGILWAANSHPIRPNYTTMISITISIVLIEIPKNY